MEHYSALSAVFTAVEVEKSHGKFLPL